MDAASLKPILAHFPRMQALFRNNSLLYEQSSIGSCADRLMRLNRHPCESGPAKTKELYMTAACPGAEERMAHAENLAAGPRITLSYMKQTLNGTVTASLSETLDMEARNHSRFGLTEDHLEAARAFVEKRKPVFWGGRPSYNSAVNELYEL